MKKILSLFTMLMLFVSGANAEEVVYALNEGDTFSSGESVDVKDAGSETVATITFGESGGNAFNAAVADGSVEGFTAYTAGNGTNGNKPGGTFYTIVPSMNGKISVAVVLNSGKAFHISEDGTDLENYAGITVDEKYYGTYSFDVKAGSSYKFYCDGSKLGFYGFKYSYGSGGGGGGENYVIDFSAQGFENAQEVTTVSPEGTGITVTFNQGSGSNTPKYYNTGAAVRVYGGGTMEVAASTNITNIVFTFGSGDGGEGKNAITADKGSYNEGTWSGSENAVLFTVGGTSGHRRIQQLAITLGGAVAEVATPIISGVSPFVSPTDIEITCATDGATIYYTTDGSTPTNSSTEYTGVFSISESCTVKAIAYVGSDKSAVASKSFVARTAVESIAELIALPNKAEFVFNGDAVVTYKSGNYCYIKDDTGASLIYGSTSLTNGQHIAKGWTGSVSIYNDLFEAIPAEGVTAEGDAETIKYEEATLADVTVENANKVVKLLEVTVSDLNGKSFNLNMGSSQVAGYNNANVKLTDGMTYNMIGAISRYKDTPQFSPLVIQKAGNPTAIEESVASGEDLAAAINNIVANNNASTITIELSKNGEYTVGATIETDAAIIINGNDATIDASAITGAFIRLATVAPNIPDMAPRRAAPEALPSDAAFVEEITLRDLNITGIKTQLVQANKQKYLVGKIALENCDIFWEATSTKKVFDFANGGNVQEISVVNSTLGSVNTNINGFFTTQSSQTMEELGADKQKVSIANSTFYNIASGKNFNEMREKGKDFQTYEATNSIFVNCGKNGQVIVGLNGGQKSDAPTWNVSGNAFNFYNAETEEMEDVSATEASKAGKKNDKDIVAGSVAGIVVFVEPETGDFRLANCPQLIAKIGDPRWIDEVLATAADELAKEVAAAMVLLGNTDPESSDVANKLYCAIIEAKEILESESINSDYFINALNNLKAAEQAFKEATAEKHYYIIGNAANEWKRTEIPEMVFNEETQAYEYELTITTTDYFAIVDKVLTPDEEAADSDWNDFNTNHRYAIAAGDNEAKVGEAMQMIKVNGTMVLKDAGTYHLSMTKDLLLTITATTGIQTITGAEAADGAYYNMQGVRVAQPTKGVFIHNGRKVVVK